MANCFAKQFFIASVEVWREGVEARKFHRPREKCPYKLRWWQRGQISFARRLWVAGWEHEDKRSTQRKEQDHGR